MFSKRLFFTVVISVFLLFSLLQIQLAVCIGGVAQAHAPDAPTAAEPSDRITRFLVLGCDRAAKLSDSIFIVALNETKREASILQIPRDTYAEYTSKDYKKLNGAYNALGPDGMKAFLSEALGVPLHYFVVLNLQSFRRLVDDIGGVDVDSPQEMIYSDPAQDLEIRLPAGRTHLDGKMAEHFVRYRSGYANADLGRLDAQKLFLLAFAQKCRTLTSGQILRLALTVVGNLQTDIGIVEAIRVASVLMECNTDVIPMATVSGQAVQGVSGAWYYSLNRSGTVRMLNEYLLPSLPMEDQNFDPKRLFDRSDHPKFHAIYSAEEEALPLP